ncbi:MAG: polysaccharide biosynthesis C-terminal domain-containing protein, partial [Clostridia bacterium]|nr:polysaccharide biosynthesis C-terminal domain-containing protein [Clostridia bacterium]
MKKQKELIHDLTTGSVPGTLLRFAMPLFLSGFLQMVYNMVDMIIVGRFVGTEGLSAVSIGGEMLQLMTFVAMGLSNAGQIQISRYVGEERRDKVGEMVGTMFTLMMSLAVLLMIGFLMSYRGIINWLNTPDDIWEYTCQYSVTCVYGLVFIYGYNLVSAILRGMGDSKHPFEFIAIATVINIVLDLLFVGPLHMGPMGAALATVIGQAVSFLCAIRLLYRNRVEIGFDFKPAHFRIYRQVIGDLVSLGIPMMIQSAAITFSMLFVNSYVNTYGTTAVAVTGVARKLENLRGLITQAMSSAG